MAFLVALLLAMPWMLGEADGVHHGAVRRSRAIRALERDAQISARVPSTRSCWCWRASAGLIAFLPVPAFRNAPMIFRVVLAFVITIALFPVWPSAAERISVRSASSPVWAFSEDGIRTGRRDSPWRF